MSKKQFFAVALRPSDVLGSAASTTATDQSDGIDKTQLGSAGLRFVQRIEWLIRTMYYSPLSRPRARALSSPPTSIKVLYKQTITHTEGQYH